MAGHMKPDFPSKDFAVVGFDDIPAAEFACPPLTTIVLGDQPGRSAQAEEGKEKEDDSRRHARPSSNGANCGAKLASASPEDCGWKTDIRPISENPRARITRLMLAEIFWRRGEVFMAGVVCFFASSLRRSFGRWTVRYPVQMIFWTLVYRIAKNSEEIFLSMLWPTLLLTIHRSKVNLAERV